MCQEIENRMIKYLVFVLIILAAFVASGRCAVSKKPNGNSLGVVQYQNNPLTYKEGNIVEAAYVSSDKAVVIRIQPRGTYGLFTEDILLCSGAAAKLNGKSNPLVISYQTQSHHLVEGVGCHELMYVDEVK